MKNSIIATSRFPEFFREEYPVFIEFIDLYYGYLDSLQFNFDSIKDLDNTNDIFLSHFREVLAKEVPVFRYISTREFLKNAAEVYSSRGSERCLKFLFRVAFGDDITVKYPKFNILRASDSAWQQEYHIRVKRNTTNEQVATTVPPGKFNPVVIVNNDIIEWSNEYGNFEITVKRRESVQQEIDLVFFETKSKLHVNDLQSVYIKRKGNIVFQGNVTPTISSIQIVKPGEFWQKGQIIRLKSLDQNSKDTLIRVQNTGSLGDITSTEIIQYGYNHNENTAVIVSPYKNKPPSPPVVLDSVINESRTATYQYVAYDYTLSISDYTEGFTEQIFGTSTRQTYYISNYYSADYYGSREFAKYETPVEYNAVLDSDADVSYEDWLKSRATLVARFANIVRGKGKFANPAGLLSDRESVIQDNYYYQNFSYVISTAQNYADAKHVIDFNHPAGMKAFVESRKDVFSGIKIGSSRTITQDYISVFDLATITDYNIKHTHKNLTEYIILDDPRINIQMGKSILDYVQMSDGQNGGAITQYFDDVQPTGYNLNSTYSTKVLEIK